MDRPDRIDKSRDRERAALAFALDISEQNNQIEILLLQHPQEPDKTLGTAALCIRVLKKSQLKVGLSWRSLSQALGREAKPTDWGVLYLGGQKPEWKAKMRGREVVWIDKKAGPQPDLPDLKGLVVLDGTWSQAKAMWWRNPWLLKLKRIVLQPKVPSLYGKLRREPRRECLSTIESVALTVGALGETEQVVSELKNSFKNLLEAYQKSNNRT